MNILIFGASGGTGINLINQSLKCGHHVTAFVRNPGKISIKDKNLSIIKGDALIRKDVEGAIKGQDIVISLLGNKTSDALWRSNTIISDGVSNIISGMKIGKVKRLIFIASFGVNQQIFLPEKLVIKTVLRNLFADIPRQEEMIKKSGLSWTLIHPARLVDGPKTGKYRSSQDLSIGLFSKISRADVAGYILKVINDDGLVGKTVTISS